MVTKLESVSHLWAVIEFSSTVFESRTFYISRKCVWYKQIQDSRIIKTTAIKKTGVHAAGIETIHEDDLHARASWLHEASDSTSI